MFIQYYRYELRKDMVTNIKQYKLGFIYRQRKSINKKIYNQRNI